MQIPSRANVVPAPSTTVLRRAAETRPTGKATATAMTSAQVASWRLGLIRRLTFVTTGSWLRMERPRSPRSSRAIQERYWRGSGWSSPSSRRRLVFTEASTDSAIMASTGSPGVRWMSAKTPAVTRKSTGTVASTRRRTRPVMESERRRRRGRSGDRPALGHHPGSGRLAA